MFMWFWTILSLGAPDEAQKPRTSNVQRHRANLGSNSDQPTSDYYNV